MEHFIVSARKYRPSRFEEVVGQRAITNTLENAIANDHLAQALLFTGPRGVGKTTCARILAKMINDDGTHHEEEDFAFNIFELDAASNNSVDDIRNLIDQVRIPPQIGKFKVYIIDEVHMLSSSAFNAFLKTLEEPPRHAIFILATTEKHKIIPTILSRCQIFDFKRITVGDIKEQLARVAKSEGVDAEDDALHLIAQKADGAMRDALSIFDRVVSFSGNTLTRQAVSENLNVLDYAVYFELTDLILRNDIPNLLVRFNEILAKGFDGHHFIAGLASHFRDLLVSKSEGTVGLLEVGSEVRQMYLDQSAKTQSDFLIRAIELANQCDLQYKSSRNQRLLVELCLMQLASLGTTSEKKKPEGFILPPSRIKVEKPTQAVNGSDITEPEPELVIKESSTSATPTPVPKKMEQAPAPQKELSVPKDPKVAPLIDGKSRRASALSLKSIQQKRKLEQVQRLQQNKEEQPEEDFNEEQMLEAWNAYTKRLERSGKYNLHSHLSMGTPGLEGHLIHLVFPNDTIKVEVERAKSDLLKHMRKQLRNHKVDLSIEVNEAEQKRYAYTAREKYELLKERNPLIEELRKTFDLEI
jgi:DNA polymerase-3 subunit gamma/tau